jgi:ribonuclease R
MAKALYSTKNIGHFGLAFKFYTHFTSPIRRYPDLMSHRLLRAHLDGKIVSKNDTAHYERMCIQSSAREVRAVEAERDSIKFKQVEFLKDRIGEIFDGTISGVTEWGIYVEEKSSKAEGMVRLATMKEDYYQLDRKNYRVKGDRTKKTHALGDTVKIRLTAANLEDRTLDFSLV